ncbi:MAG: polysaccharide export protein [Rhodospirillales bacterium]|nr:polysaccharide export protein [Rhodospirillales bacterium]MCB9980229.1 polysaccharide export protein [Rhodospirillales bacterium]
MLTLNIKSYAPFILLGILVIFLTGCAVSPSSGPVPESHFSSQSYTLGVGDKLRITVYGQDQLTGEYTVDSNGEIAFPLVQNISAKGLTLPALQKKIINTLSPKYLKNPKVSVEIIEYRGVYVLGEVRNPGKFPYVPNMTVLQAVAIAGGHTYRAQENWAEITRDTEAGLATFQATSKNFVEPGDTIIVKRRWF